MTAQQHPPHEFNAELPHESVPNPSLPSTKQRGSLSADGFASEVAEPSEVVDRLADRPFDGRPQRSLGEQRVYSFMIRRGYAGNARQYEVVAASQVHAQMLVDRILADGEEAFCFGYEWRFVRSRD